MEKFFFGLGAVSPPALTPRVKRVTRSVSPPGARASVGATAGSGGATAGIPRRKEKKNFLPPFCLASSLKIISYTLMDHFELKKKEGKGRVIFREAYFRDNLTCLIPF